MYIVVLEITYLYNFRVPMGIYDLHNGSLELICSYHFGKANIWQWLRDWDLMHNLQLYILKLPHTPGSTTFWG